MAAPSFELGHRRIDLAAQTIHDPRTGATSTLTDLEARLLEHLYRADGALVQKAVLLREVWGYADGVESRAVDYTVRRLRKKLEDTPKSPVHLVNVYGSGIGLHAVTRTAVSLDTRPPLPIDTFVGRTTERARLDRWLADSARVVAIIGAGGVGKTRFLLEWTRTQPEDHIRWVALGAVRDAVGLSRAVLDTFGLPGSDPLPARALLDGPLILDEAEGCIDALDQVLPTWLQATPTLQVVVTSRIAPATPGVLPLRLPPLSANAATRLYEARAATAGALHALDHPLLPQLVQRLEGSPLAIELAAARAGVRPVPELLAALERPLDTLQHPRRSLRDVLAWSWSLLSAEQARVLAACSVFPGRFGRDAAEAAAGPHAIAILDQLHARSLVHAFPGTRRTFTLAMGVRDYAAEQLPSAQRTATEGRLVAWVLRRTGQGRHPPRRAWVLDELELLRSLLQRLTDRSAPEAIPLATAVAPTFADRGWGDEALAPLAHLPDEPGLPAIVRARVLGMVSRFDDARATLTASLSAPDPHIRRSAHVEAAVLWMGQTELGHAHTHLQAAEALLATHPDPTDQARLHRYRSILHSLRGEYDQALIHSQACLASWTHIGDPHAIASAQAAVGMTYRGLGRHEEARQALQHTLDFAESIGVVRSAAVLHVNLGVIHIELGARHLAAHHFRRGLALHKRTGNRTGAGYAWLNLAGIAFWEGHLAEADAALLEARAIAAAIGDSRIGASADAVEGVGMFATRRYPDAHRLVRAARLALIHLGAGRTVGWLPTYEALAERILGLPPDPELVPNSPPVVAIAEALLNGQHTHAAALFEALPHNPRTSEDGRYLHTWLRRHIDRGTTPKMA